MAIYINGALEGIVATMSGRPVNEDYVSLTGATGALAFVATGTLPLVVWNRDLVSGEDTMGPQLVITAEPVPI